MSKIKNYDSTLALDNHQIDHAYTLFIHNQNKNKLVKIDNKQFTKHTKSLTNIINSNNEIQNNS